MVITDDCPTFGVESLGNVGITSGVFAQTVHEHDQPGRFVCRVVIKPQLQPVTGRNMRWNNAINHGAKYAFCVAIRVMRHSKRTKFLRELRWLIAQK